MLAPLAAAFIAAVVSVEEVVRVSPCGGVIIALSVEPDAGFDINYAAPWSLKFATADLQVETVERKDASRSITFVAETRCRSATSFDLHYELGAFVCNKAEGSCRKQMLRGRITERNIQ